MKELLLLFVLSIYTLASAQVTGPNAPEVTITYTTSAEPGFSFHLFNPTSSNNYLESYLEFDSNINAPTENQFWRFQGYMIFQLLSDTIDFNKTFDSNFSKLVAVADVSDSFSTINLILDSCVSIPLTLGNTGAFNDILVLNDAFTSSPFVANQLYCFRVVAFAKNPLAQDVNCGINDYAVIGQTNGEGLSVPSICVTASEPLGLSEVESESIAVSPNPSIGSFSFKRSSKTDSPYKLSIFNDIGQLVWDKILTDEEVEFEVPSRGVFWLQIESEGKCYQRKLIRL